jgi:hypothetical protein
MHLPQFTLIVSIKSHPFLVIRCMKVAFLWDFSKLGEFVLHSETSTEIDEKDRIFAGATGKETLWEIYA